LYNNHRTKASFINPQLVALFDRIFDKKYIIIAANQRQKVVTATVNLLYKSVSPSTEQLKAETQKCQKCTGN